MGVPIIRTIVFWGLYWGPPSLGNYHVLALLFAVLIGYAYGYCTSSFSGGWFVRTSRSSSESEGSGGGKALAAAAERPW